MAATTGSAPARCTPCPVCGADAGARAEVAGLVSCAQCSHVWEPSLSVPTNEVFESDEYAAWRASSVEHRAIAAARIDAVEHLLGRPTRSLEIGCSTGEAVAELRDRGWESYGLDLSAEAVRAGRSADPGLALAVGTAPVEAGFPDRYGLVVAFHVVEHVPDLAGLGASLAELLDPGGLLYVRVPNWASWSRRSTGRWWPDLMPEHVHQFTPDSARRWVGSAGLEPVLVTTEGRAREWLGAARRAVGRVDPSAAGTSEVAPSPSRLRMVARLERLGRPWLAIEERRHAGSELVVLARRPA